MAINLPSYLATAFQLWVNDGTAGSVTLTPDGGDAVTVAGVTNGKLSRAQLQMLGELGVESDVRSFSLPVGSLGDVVPGRGDRITDSFGVWRIQSSELRTLDTRYFVVCIKEL